MKIRVIFLDWFLLFPLISIASGAIVFFMVAVMLITRIRRFFRSVDIHHTQLHKNSHHNNDNQLNKNGHRHAHGLWNHHDHDHHHGHSHMTAGNDELPVTWKQLLGLGVSGGILPCPSALVVLLAAISLHRIGFGLLLIIAFTIGLASVLTCMGILFVKERQLMDRIQTTGQLLKLLPALSALVIMVLGIGIIMNALTQVV